MQATKRTAIYPEPCWKAIIALVCVVISTSKEQQAHGCSFIVTNFDCGAHPNGNYSSTTFQEANFYNRLRGPDATHVVRKHGWSWVHNLLSMTGNATLQPFVSSDDNDEQVVTLFNGEIYNFRELQKELGAKEEYQSDGYAILPSYQKWGDDFISHFQGEFAIVLVDYAASKVILATDAFSTKPLWYSMWQCKQQQTQGYCFAVASYQSVLRGLGAPLKRHVMANANEVVTLDISTNNFRVTSRQPTFRFDLRQFKTTTLDWEQAFIQAVKRRTLNIKHKLFIGLSAGYDTGAIMLALQILEIPFYAYYVGNRNDDEITIRQRIGYCENSEGVFLYLTEPDFLAQKDFLQVNAERFFPMRGRLQKSGNCNAGNKFAPYAKGKKGRTTADFRAAIATSAILSDVRSRGGLIYLTGTGADEIISDYARDGKPLTGLGNQSTFGGVFPQNLSDIYPWCNFYYGTMRDFIMYTELTGGAHGIESRYPFLDPLVVQEYLWLTPELKNQEYKKPIAEFLRRYEFPNMWAIKTGFGNPQFNNGSTSIKAVLKGGSDQDIDAAKGAELRRHAFGSATFAKRESQNAKSGFLLEGEQSSFRNKGESNESTIKGSLQMKVTWVTASVVLWMLYRRKRDRPMLYRASRLNRDLRRLDHQTSW